MMFTFSSRVMHKWLLIGVFFKPFPQSKTCRLWIRIIIHCKNIIGVSEWSMRMSCDWLPWCFLRSIKANILHAWFPFSLPKEQNQTKQKILPCKSDNRSVSRAIYIGAGYIRFFCARDFISIFILEHIRPVLQLGNVIGLCFWQNNIRPYSYLNENMWCTMN